MKILRQIGISVGILICLLGIVVFVMRYFRPVVYKIAWKEEFGKIGSSLPAGWQLRGKPGTPKSVFSVQKEKGVSFLHMEADKASASLICKPGNIDLEKAPYLRWRWRVKTLPRGADGRVKAKDDQAVGIYVGAGSMLNQKTVSYRWDTETPDGTEGKAIYGGGTVKVVWYTLRDKNDVGNGQWLVEERNFAEDFRKAWGYYPEKVYLSVSCNSQYTGTKAAADLDWIEFTAGPGAGQDANGQKK